MKIKNQILLVLAMAGLSVPVSAQLNESGITAGFFDGSKEQDINFSTFHLPPMAVLFENAKQTPQILSLEKAKEIAKAEVAKQKRHIFSYLHGHASYSYGKTDMWGNNSSTYNNMIYQFQGSTQSYWNVGVNLAVPFEDILDLGAAVKRKRLLVEEAQIKKDIAYDQLKLQIASLYVRITNNIIALKTSSEAAAAYQGAGALNEEEFRNDNMEIEDYAYTRLHEISVVKEFQELQTTILTDILTLEILTHTPIITNSTTEITLDSDPTMTAKEARKHQKAVDKQIKKETIRDAKRLAALEKAEQNAKTSDGNKKDTNH